MGQDLDSRKLAVVIPVYNEGGRLGAVVLRLASHLAQLPLAAHVVVVDDGSARAVASADVAVGAQSPVSVHLLRHAINLGQGAALQTGVEFARDVLGADVFVTMDADGQHDPADLPALLKALDGVDIVFGNRFAGEGASYVPPGRRALLRAARLFERVLTRLDLSDAHNGYRAFNRRFAEVLSLRQNRMAHATEVKQTVARHRLRYGEVPVVITYTADTLAKGQRSSGSFFILRDLLGHTSSTASQRCSSSSSPSSSSRWSPSTGCSSPRARAACADCSPSCCSRPVRWRSFRGWCPGWPAPWAWGAAWTS